MGLRIALFGQAAYGKEVLDRILAVGHEVVGVYAPPVGGRPDPLAAEAEARSLPLFRYGRFRARGQADPSILEEYRALDPELAVLAYVTVILPSEIVEHPARGGLCFHPSLLPRFRGGSAIPWQIILGEQETGVTVFRPDAGVDTGPIIVQKRGIPIDAADTAGSLYYRKLYPLAVEAMLEAVELVATGMEKPVAQDESAASFQGLLTDDAARVDWRTPVVELDRLLRGCDPQPGAHARFGDLGIRLFDARRLPGEGGAPAGTVVAIDENGMILAAEGGRLCVGRVRLGSGPKQSPGEAGVRVGDRLV